MDGILAHLSGRISGRQELIATEGLTYLLENSPACRSVMRRLARQVGVDLPDNLLYRSEVAGEFLERPDIVGIDANGQERLIIEGKFYAGLTDNQPSAYIERLAGTQSLLVFVVPGLRVQPLWNELRARIGHSHGGPVQELELPEVGPACKVSEDRAVLMVSWNHLLESFTNAAAGSADTHLSDMRQLLSLAAKIEGGAFVPFTSEELTSIRMALRNRDLCNVVDGIVDRLLSRNLISLEGLRATPTRSGYLRYVWLGRNQDGYGGYIALDYDLWRASNAGPLWIAPWNDTRTNQSQLYQEVALNEGVRLEYLGTRPALPLPVAANREFDQVVADRCGRLEILINLLCKNGS